MNESELDEQIMNHLSFGRGSAGWDDKPVLELRWKGRRVDYLDAYDLRFILENGQ